MALSRHYESKCILRQLSGGGQNIKYELHGEQVILGKNKQCGIPLLNTSVSPEHCVLTFNGEEWAIKDNNSSKCTYVNGYQLRENEVYRLISGDIIFLGNPAELPPSFAYEEVTDILNSDATSSDSDDESVYDSSDDINMCFSDCGIKRACESDSEIPSKKTALDILSHSVSETEEEEDESDEREKDLEYKIAILEVELRSLRASKVKIGENPTVVKKQVEREKDLEYKIAYLQTEIRSLRISNYNKIMKEKAEKAKEREEKEKNIKNKVAYFQAKVKSLRLSMADLGKNLAEACKTIHSLDSKLVENKKEVENEILKHELKVKSELLEKCEEDLICTICTELFIKPTILGCSHTFCQHCIMEWRKNLNVCPICRCVIVSVTPVRTLKQFLDKTLATLSPDQQERRATLIAERDRENHAPVLRCQVCLGSHDQHSRSNQHQESTSDYPEIIRPEVLIDSDDNVQDFRLQSVSESISSGSINISGESGVP